MAAIVGTKAAKEVSICRNGANQHAHVLITKSLDPLNPAPAAKAKTADPENDKMDIAVAKALVAMNEVTKTYFLALADDAATAFLAKSAADQTAEAEAAKKVTDDAAAKEKSALELAEAAKTDLTKRVEQAEKTNSDLAAELETLKQDRELEKAAGDSEFDGYPGGVDAVKSVLKSIAKVDDAGRAAVIDGMKAKAKAAKATTAENGGRTDDEIAKQSPKTAEWNKAVANRMTEKSVDKSTATQQLAEEPAYKALYSAVLAEQGAL